MTEILEGLLSEGEVMDMPEETLQAFVQMFSQELFKALVEYIESPTSNTEVVAKLNEAVGSIVMRSTFHNKVKERGIKSTTYDNPLKRLPQRVFDNEVDVDALIEDLTWLDNNTGNLASTLPVRTKDMYDAAFAKIKEYEANPTLTHDHEISKQMELYKELLFCPRRTKAVETGMRSLTLNKNRWRMQLRAAEYLRYCKMSGITPEIAREI